MCQINYHYFLKKSAKKYNDYLLLSIDETNDYYIGWVGNPYEENQDLPILVYDKNKKELSEERIPPVFNDDEVKTIWNFDEDADYIKQNQEKIEKLSGGLVKFENTDNEGNDMEENKIRSLLKRYGAEDSEIENFMRDLAEVKDDAEEDEEDDFNYLDEETMTKLKATEEGKDLIMNAPKMAKDELKKAIMDYLSK